jgi:hypothetical protein
MKLTDTLPRAVTWVIRFICWSASLFVIWILFRFYANMKLINNVAACMETMQRGPSNVAASSLEASKEMVACLDKQAGFPVKFMYASDKKAILALPSIPCRYVGIWTATRGNTVYRVTLKDDSQFSAEPLRDDTHGARLLRGSWGAYDGRMIWMYDEGRFWPPDINPITTISDGSFNLQEADGSMTRYDLVERVQSAACTPN